MDFAQFLRAKWRWIALVLAVIFAVPLLTQLFDYGLAWRGQRKEAKKVEALDTARTARLARDATHRSSFDSAVWALAGRHREMLRQSQLIKRHDDSLTNILPAVPALPQRPARY